MNARFSYAFLVVFPTSCVHFESMRVGRQLSLPVYLSKFVPCSQVVVRKAEYATTH